MKKAVSILLCIALIAALFAFPANAITEDEANAGYYLVGTMTDWDIDVYNYRLSQNPQNPDEYMLSGVSLTTSDSFKVVYTHDGRTVDEWFPFGVDNDCSLAAMGIYSGGPADIYFRPDMNGNEGWYFDCIYIEMITPAPSPTDPPEPTVPESKAGYYLVYKEYDWAVNENNKLLNYYGDIFMKGNVTLSTSDRIKVVYSSDGEHIDQWYPSEEDEGYAPRYNSRHYTVEYYVDCRGDDDSYKGWIKAYPCEPPGPVNIPEYRYKDDFESVFGTENCIYDEVYYHYFEGDYIDWALIRADGIYPLYPGMTASLLPYHGVFDEVIAYNLGPKLNGKDYFGFFVYDITARKFYDIGEAWNMGFRDLHNAFLCYALNHLDCDYLGDVDHDGAITIIDVTLIQRFQADMIDLNGDDWISDYRYGTYICGPDITYQSDFDCDGKREITDATFIQRHLVDLSIYPHDITVTAAVGRVGNKTLVQACSAFSEEPIEYCYTIDGGLHAESVYGDDFGIFNYFDPDYEPEPGDFRITTGYISDDTVEIPVSSLTYNDSFTVTVTAKDKYGHKSIPAQLCFNNVY